MVREHIQINGLYNMRTFDPFNWFEHMIPARWLHWIIRAVALTAVLGFLVMRLGQYHDYFFKPLWMAETLLFVVLAIAFAVRTDPADRSRGVGEIIVPLLGSILPFGLLFTQPSAWILESKSWLTAVFIWMTVATGFTTWSLWVLRKSFSITVEARSLVTSGPYQWVRHPVYLGEIFTAAAVVAWRWSLENTGIFILFVLVQLLRARWEEEKLARVFPEYSRFAGRSMWVWSMGKKASETEFIRAVVLLGIFGLMPFWGCAASSGPVTGEDKNIQQRPGLIRSARIIIKFKNIKTDPTQVEFLKQLSRDAEASLHYLRPMSGNAHVLRISGITEEKQITEIIRRLSKNPDVDYVEEDSMMVHQ
jgi:protein-S-isoprenylcysteine O-methyltransferase Ste14